MTKTLLLLLCVSLALLPPQVRAQADPEVRTLTPEELENLEFRQRDGRPVEEEDPPTIEELSMGQRYILSTQRREAKDLIARELGVMSLKLDASDLRIFQQLHDRRILKDNQVQEWQGMGVLFGDILVEQYGLEWVSYEDELGDSKALRWRETNNYVFPITVFSKRLQFGQKIDAREIFEKISADIERFIEYERESNS